MYKYMVQGTSAWSTTKVQAHGIYQSGFMARNVAMTRNAVIHRPACGTAAILNGGQKSVTQIARA